MGIIDSFVLLLYIGVAFSLSNAWLTWNIRIRQARTYSLLLSCTAIWALFAAHELQSHSHGLQPLWSSLAYLGSAWVGPLLFLTSLESPKTKLFSRPNTLHAIFPILVILLVATNPWHGWFYTHYETLWIGNRPITQYGHGWAFWFYIAGTYLYSSIATGIISYRIITTQGHVFTRLLWMFAFAFPWVSSFLYLSEWMPIPGLDPTPLAYTCTVVLLTIAMRHQNFFDPNVAAHTSLLKSLSDGILVFDHHGMLCDFNQTASSMLGITLETGKTRFSSLPPPFQEPSSLAPLTWNHRLISHKTIPLSHSKTPTGSLLILHDITEKVAAETRIRLLSKAIESGPTAVVVTDLQGRIVYVNQRFCNVSGYTENDVLGKRPRFMSSAQNPPRLYKTIWNKIQSGQVWRGELLSKRKNGLQYWHRIDVAPMQGPDGKITHFVALTEDITDRKAMQQRLEEMASTDLLTGLYNRRFVLQMGQKEVAKHRRGRRALAVGLIEIDNFRSLNDSYGHTIGDQILCHLSTLVRDFFREGDLIGRFDGDAFLLFFPDTHTESAMNVCQRLQTHVAQSPLPFAKHPITYSISIGVAVLQNQDTLEQLVQRAETALQNAKTCGVAQIFIEESA